MKKSWHIIKSALDQPAIFEGQAANILILGLTSLALVAVPLSLARGFYTGFHFTHLIHVLALLPLLILTLWRHRFSARLKAGFSLCLALTVAGAGMVKYALLGNGMIWSMVAVTIALYFLSLRRAILVSLVPLAIFIITAIMFIQGRASLPLDPHQYLREPASWFTALVGALLFVGLVLFLFVLERARAVRLVADLEAKNREIWELADFDTLTRLPVLRVFKRDTELALNQQDRENRFVALCFIDLDGFKEINDTYGHDAGDFLLVQVARRLEANIRHQDIPARMGGDEFLLLLNNPSFFDLSGFCERLLASLAEPCHYEGHELKIEASVGVACSRNRDMSVEELIQCADQAMYQVKKSGKNGYRIVPDCREGGK